jgi:Helix-turn-helix of DDE superfamily endonuclease
MKAASRHEFRQALERDSNRACAAGPSQLHNRVLLVAAYWRTNLTLRQLALLSGVSKSAADRTVDHLGPALGLQPRKRFTGFVACLVATWPGPSATGGLGGVPGDVP